MFIKDENESQNDSQGWGVYYSLRCDERELCFECVLRVLSRAVGMKGGEITVTGAVNSR